MLEIFFPDRKPLNLLFLGAHCDDIEIGAGATLLKLKKLYAINEVRWIVFCSNEIRKKEALHSARLFLDGIEHKTIEINQYRDGFLPFEATEVKDHFENFKKSFNPDIIFTHFRDDRHQDHRLISDLTWNTWRNHFILEYEVPKYDGDIGAPNFFVQLEEKEMNRKIEILMESFTSQSEKHWFQPSIFTSIARLRGMESATRFAESFYARKVVM
jgi:LmbE family N-acetylglucosaminyl deacetylase